MSLKRVTGCRLCAAFHYINCQQPAYVLNSLLNFGLSNSSYSLMYRMTGLFKYCYSCNWDANIID